MQETLKFFETIWPDSGYYCIAVPYAHGGFDHKVFEDREQAVKHALTITEQDVFFAVGTLAERKYWNATKVNKRTGEVGKWEVRCAANTLKHKTLISDIDCGEDKDYKTQVEALHALKKFCTDAGMPQPIINSSGGGLHCYWPLSEEIPSEDWKRIGSKLQLIFSHFGLLADSTATEDRARVLRVPGTYNCKKDEKRLTQILKWSDKVGTPDKIEAKFDKLIAENNIKASREKPVKISDAVSALFADVTTLSAIQNFPDKDQDLIVSKCAQMKRCMEVGGAVGYAMRGHALSVIKFTKQQDYSALYNDPQPDVVETQNDAMLLDSITDNPHTCEKFKNTYAEGCKDCKHKVTSPIILGIIKENTKSVEEVTEAELVQFKERLDDLTFRKEDGITPPTSSLEPWRHGMPRFPIPNRYRMDNAGIWKAAVSDDADAKESRLCSFPFYPYDVIKDECDETIAICYAKIGTGRPIELKIPLRMVSSPSELAAEFSAKGMITSSKQAQQLLDFMASYIDKIIHNITATEQYNQLGWKVAKNTELGIHAETDPDKFVLPYCTIDANGVKKAEPSKKLKAVVDIFGECGTLDEWKRVIDVYNRQGYEGYAFGVLSALGSPLMTLTNYSGAIVSMVGDSSAGKSTVLRAINSFFARPDSFLTQSDTLAAFAGMIGLYGSIAITADEITDLPPERVSALAYSISQGRDRHSMTADRTIKDNESTWKLLMVSSSNRSLLTKLAEFKRDSSAEAFRVFEFNLNTSDHKISKQEAEAVFPVLLKNYGHAGKIYISYVVKNLDRVKQMLLDTSAEIDRLANTTTQERYWTVAVVVNIVGGMIAKELGLINYDIDAIKLWAVKQIESMRGNTSENIIGTSGTLSAYLSESIGNTITIGGQGTKAKPFYSVKDPTQRVWNRYEADTQLLYLNRAQFRSFVVQGGGDYNKVKAELRVKRILLNDGKLTTLTKGSSISSAGQAHCLVIDASHEEVMGAEGILKIISQDTAKIA